MVALALRFVMLPLAFISATSTLPTGSLRSCFLSLVAATSFATCFARASLSAP